MMLFVTGREAYFLQIRSDPVLLVTMILIRDVYPGSDCFPAQIRIKEFKIPISSVLRIQDVYPVPVSVFFLSRIPDPHPRI